MTLAPRCALWCRYLRIVYAVSKSALLAFLGVAEKPVHMERAAEAEELGIFGVRFLSPNPASGNSARAYQIGNA